jgi:hypothetical protein
MTRRRLAWCALAGAVLFATAAASWWAFAVPILVKYPTDLHVTPRYEGEFTLFVDPATAAPLATPLRVPLDIKRDIRSIRDESDSSRVVVKEAITQRATGLFHETQTNVYVMDRRTLQNVADNRAFAFDSSNVVDRSGTYRLNLPFDTSPSAMYPIYKNETAMTYRMRASTTAPDTGAPGLELHTFKGSASEVPLDAAYLAELNKTVALPKSMSLEQLKPRLEAFGLDIEATLGAVAPVITPEDAATLSRVAAKPIPLLYVLSFEGTAAVETTTGAEVDVGAREWVGAKPMPADVAALRAVMAHYSDVPEAVAAGDALAALSSAPATKLFEYRYQQTRTSVADIAGEVRSMRNQIRLVERYVPLSLLGVAALSLAASAFAFSSRRGRAIDVSTAQKVVGTAPGREPVSTGAPR